MVLLNGAGYKDGIEINAKPQFWIPLTSSSTPLNSVVPLTFFFLWLNKLSGL